MTQHMHGFSLGVGMSLFVLGSVGCASLFGDPEASSGPDAYRHQALPLALDEAVTDSLSIADGDQTDWRLVEIYDAGQLSIELRVDEAEASLSAGVYDRYGREMKIFKVPGGKLSTFTVDVTRGGRYFLRVRSESGPLTSYDVRVFEGGPRARQQNDVPKGRPGF